VAFAGRSNSGKSSALNAITRNSKLARTSKTPGRTRLINFFTLSRPGTRLVDLPGYGYARVSREMQQDWEKQLGAYLEHRQSLRGMTLIMDIRHPLSEFDEMLIEWCQHHELPMLLLLTKADKLKKNPARQQVRDVQNALRDVPASRGSSHSPRSRVTASMKPGPISASGWMVLTRTDQDPSASGWAGDSCGR